MVIIQNHPIKQQMDAMIMAHPDIFSVPIPAHWRDIRELTTKQFEVAHANGLFKKSYYDDPTDFFILCENLHYINPSLAIKLGVNYILFGGALYFLGTKPIHTTVLDELLSGKTTGCFAMTEIGHGSNLRDIETTATLDSATGELVIHTPTDTAVKCWIGGGTVAKWSVVFVQLVDNGVNRGVHAVLVPIAQNPTVEVRDMGAKLGLNGVDNTYIRFHHTRVPVSHLLGKYGDFVCDTNETTKWTYKSPISNNDVRFGKMLGALSLGRVSIAIGAYAIAYKSYQIALKYNLERRQFRIPANSKSEKPIASYTTSLERFTEMKASLDGIRKGLLELMTMYKKKGLSPDVHGYSSLLKVFASWEGLRITNICREMCGGHGFSWANELGLLLNDIHVYVTFEGDNTVLLQQGMKWLLKRDKSLAMTRFKLRLAIGNKVANWMNMLPEIRSYTMDYMRNHLQTIPDTMYSMQVFVAEQKMWEADHRNKVSYIPIYQYPQLEGWGIPAAKL
jgi:acyl-CoA oxidase